ncbi:MAG: hypothetical protein U0R19_13645 [Bryobacteraceae bacterium]
MGVKTYTSVPSARQFQSDSSVAFAVRKSDIILTHIDWLLSKLETTPEKSTVILCDLFMTCNFWIKSYHDRNPTLDRGRYPVILALFESVVNALAAAWSCGQMKVAQTLREIYGRDMHEHGFTVDLTSGRAQYFSPLEAAQYRARFKGGLVYQYQWWENKASHKLVLADSYRCYTEVQRKGTDGTMTTNSPGFCIFAMDIERVLYLGKADVGGVGSYSGTFHSSFNSGGLLTMAGTIYIMNGKIEAIRADSGHYKPNEQNMAFFLQALAMYGVNVENIILYSWDGQSMGFALNFLKSKMSWPAFEQTRRKERAHRIGGDDYRELKGMPRKFPDLKRGPAYTRPSANQSQVAVVAPSGDADFYMAED